MNGFISNLHDKKHVCPYTYIYIYVYYEKLFDFKHIRRWLEICML